MLCGFAKREITPEPGVYLAGNGEYKSVGINDPLAARAIVLEDKGEWAAFVSADIIGIEIDTVEKIREHLAAAGRGTPRNIFISCTHTHNGPHTRFNRTIFERYRDRGYLELLALRIAEAVLEADGNKEAASFKFARGHAFENFNRRIVTPDGRAHFYNPKFVKNHPEIARGVSGVADSELDALQFYGTDGSVLCTLVHYAAHPLTVGIYRDVISADFPGALAGALESAYKAPAVFFQGACGEIHPKGLFAGFQRMKEMGKNLADEAERVLNAVDLCVYEAELKTAWKTVKMPVDIARRDRQEWWSDAYGEFYEAEMGAVSIGPVAFVSAPGEITNAAGLEIKWHSPFKQTWVLYNTNYYTGYIAPRAYYVEGGYEGECNQVFLPSACDRVIRTARELVECLYEG